MNELSYWTNNVTVQGDMGHMSGVTELRKWINEEGYEITVSNIVGFNDKIHIRITDPRTNAIYITIVDHDIGRSCISYLDSSIKDFLAPAIERAMKVLKASYSQSRWGGLSLDGTWVKKRKVGKRTESG